LLEDEAAARNADAAELRRLALGGILVMVVGLGGLGGWAAVAPLDTAVPAAGQLVVESRRKTVSLLDSGLLRELRVREGQRVAAGDVLLQLDDAQARALLDQAVARFVVSGARVGRLQAEMDDREVFEARPAPSFAEPAVAAPLIAAEVALFQARREAYAGGVAVQRRRIAQLEQQVAAHRAQATSAATRGRLLQQELSGVQTLHAQGFATRIRMLELQRNIAQLEGDAGDYLARAAEAGQAIAQAELEIVNLRSARRNDAAREMQDAVSMAAEGRARLAAADDILRRATVVAPEAGTVTELRFFTPGSSIVAGQPVLDLVPVDDRLVVEGAVSPSEIERVRVGQRVNVRLTGFSHRRAPPLPGTLVHVGADRQTNARGEPFFVVRATLSEDAFALIPGIALAAGMPADILIIGQRRTALDYLLSPLLDGMRRAWRED